MNLWRAGLLVTIFGTGLLAQKYQVVADAATPAGKLLAEISAAPGDAQKLPLLERFIEIAPTHEGAAWVYTQLIPLYVAAGAMDKASPAGDRLLALHPDDIEYAVVILKGYEKRADAAGALKWSQKTSAMAREALKTATGADQDYARQVAQYCEYALLNQTSKAPAGPALDQLVAALEVQNPQSQYLSGARNAQFVAYRQAGQNEKAAQLAEKAIAQEPNNDEMLLVMADQAMKSNDNAKTLLYATRLVDVVKAKPRPEQLSEADWTRRRGTLLGVGNWMAGVTLATTGKSAPADLALREALPLLTDDQMKAAALFHLGVVNYQMGVVPKPDLKRLAEALHFSQQSAAIAGPYQANAAKNVANIKAKYRTLK